MKRREETSKGRGREVAWDAWLLLPGLGFLLGDMVCFWEKGPFVSALLYWAGVPLYPACSNHTVIRIQHTCMVLVCMVMELEWIGGELLREAKQSVLQYNF